MLEIDGSRKSGSGTILRVAIALATVVGEPLHIINIRNRRSSPGLRPQHLEAVSTAAKLCGGRVEGAQLGSHEVWFEPSDVRGGVYTAEIGTAGSIPMVLMTILPMCGMLKRPLTLRISKGGTDVPYSPTINYLRYVLLPTLGRMGLTASVDVRRYGYYPKGLGDVTLMVKPGATWSPLRLEDRGQVVHVKGLSVCTFLKDRRVAERQATQALTLLRAQGYPTEITSVYDFSNPLQKGSSLALWAITSTGAIIGSDAIGAIRKTSETVGREAGRSLVQELAAKATVDVNLADMLVPYLAQADGDSVYYVRRFSSHLDSNLWLARTILGVDYSIKKEDGLHRVVLGT
jgi:RNA 3'-terminal phosphate cyclase (ATP)